MSGAVVVAVLAPGVVHGHDGYPDHWRGSGERLIRVRDGILRTLHKPARRREWRRVRAEALVAWDESEAVRFRVRIIAGARCETGGAEVTLEAIRSLTRFGTTTLCRTHGGLVAGWHVADRSHDGHYRRALVALSDLHLATVCHEIAHTLGLDYHQYSDETPHPFFEPVPNDVRDFEPETSCLGVGNSPDTFDLDSLARLYEHSG